MPLKDENIEDHVRQRLTRHIEDAMKEHRRQVKHLSAKSTPLLSDAGAKREFQKNRSEICAAKRKFSRQIAQDFHFDVRCWRPMEGMIFGNDLPEMLWKYKIVAQTEKLAVLFFRNTGKRGVGLPPAYSYRRFQIVTHMFAASTWGTGLRFSFQYHGHEDVAIAAIQDVGRANFERNAAPRVKRLLRSTPDQENEIKAAAFLKVCRPFEMSDLESQLWNLLGTETDRLRYYEQRTSRRHGDKPQGVEVVELTEITSPVPSAEQEFFSQNGDEELRAKVKELLTPTQSVIFCLYHFDNFTYEEIAEVLNKEGGTIRKHYSDACKRLQLTYVPD